MEFTREDYDSLPARRVEEFKKFVLNRFCAYTKYTDVYPETRLVLNGKGKPLSVDRPLDSHGWGGWKVDDTKLFTDDNYFVVFHYLEDERAPTSYSNHTRVPKAFVFGEMEEDEDYQQYLRLKKKFEEE